MDYLAPDLATETREVRVADRKFEINPLIVQLFPENDSAIKASMQNSVKTDGISRIDLPSDWTVNRRNSGIGELTVAAPRGAQGETEISVYNRGRPLPQSDSQAFDAVLENVERTGVGRLLFDSSWGDYLNNDPNRREEIGRQMQTLSGVLGRTQLGDNQFTNSRKHPDPQAPSFHVERVQVELINGRSVLSVDGYMPSPADGKPVRYFTGIFAPNPTSQGTYVNEVFLQATNRSDFLAKKVPFLQTLQSIKW